MFCEDRVRDLSARDRLGLVSVCSPGEGVEEGDLFLPVLAVLGIPSSFSLRPFM